MIKMNRDDIQELMGVLFLIGIIPLLILGFKDLAILFVIFATLSWLRADLNRLEKRVKKLEN